mgnify:CR=1 FL=1
MTEEIRAYAVKQDVVDYDAENLVMLQAQLINKDYVGRVMVEKVSKDAQSYAAGKHYIPGVAMKFGEHPVEAGHRILTEELEVEDRDSARKREVEIAKVKKFDFMFNLTGLVGLGTFVFLVYAIVYITIPEHNEKTFYTLIGLCEGIVLSIFGFYFGSSMRKN